MIVKRGFVMFFLSLFFKFTFLWIMCVSTNSAKVY